MLETPHLTKVIFETLKDNTSTQLEIEHKASYTTAVLTIHNIFWRYFMIKRHKKYYVNVFLLITPGFFKKTGRDKRLVFLKIVSSA